MKTLLCVCALIFLSADPVWAGGDQPDANGCYTNYWFDPFVLGTVCTNPALGDPDTSSFNPTRDPKPVDHEPPPPHECPYGGKPSRH